MIFKLKELDIEDALHVHYMGALFMAGCLPIIEHCSFGAGCPGWSLEQ